MMKFDFAPLMDVLPEIRACVERNFEEMEEIAGKLDIDWDTYNYAAESGQMVALVLRRDGALVGYSVFHVAPNMRNKRKIEATNHTLFLEKPYRQKFGGRMITEADKHLKRLGIHEALYSNDSEIFGRFLARAGYGPKSTVWSMKYGQ